MKKIESVMRTNDIHDKDFLTQCHTTRIVVDGENVEGFTGESILSVLFAIGRRAISQNDRGVISGAYCGMGVCYCCTVEVNGKKKVRACQEKIAEGMVVCTKTNLWTDLKRCI